MTESHVLVGDARFVLPDTLVPDVLVVDPPYRRHVHENTVSQDQHTDGNVRHNDLGFASLTEELRTWICQLAAKTRRWSLIYTDVESVAKWKDTLELAGATYIRTLPWVRWSMPALSGDRPPQGFECIVVAYGSNRGRKHWNGAGNLTHLAHELDWSESDDKLLTHISHLALRGKNKQKAEKPLDQLLDLVSWFSDRGTLDQGELIVDPCSGSGTTGLACKILGRRFIGCELDAEWAAKGNARIQACNVNDLPGSLSPRDSERFLRWVTTSEKEKVDLVERKFNTERVRKRMVDKKMALNGAPVAAREEEEEVMMMPNEWTETYQQCLTELRPPPGGGRVDGAGAPEPAVPSVAMARPPKPSAAERTVPLFEETYPVKSTWEAAYARVLVELAPPLSPALLARVAARMREQQHGFSTETASSTAAMPTEAEDPDFVAPPRDDSESGFTNPDGTLIKVHQSTPTVVLTGFIPPHILTELGMHPSLVDEPIRNRALVVARHTGWSDDWNVLQEQAPTGFFTRVLKEMQMAPGERLSVLVEAMVERGLRVSIFDAAGWSSIQRSCARACIEQNSEWPEFFSQYEGDQAGILGSCAACGRGDNRPYTHTCEKSLTLGVSAAPTPVVALAPIVPTPATEPAKRGKGRPPGVKNKMPKAWKLAHARVMAELVP